jgi:hypothetical protein
VEKHVPWLAEPDLDDVRGDFQGYVEETFHRHCTNPLDSYIMPKAEPLYESLKTRPLKTRVDLLVLTPVERRQYVDSQWPQDDQEQKNIIYNMWRPIIDHLDLDAIFDLPNMCTVEQIGHCTTIRHNLQTSFILVIDRNIDIWVRFQKVKEATTTPRLPEYRFVEGIGGVRFNEPGDGGSLVYTTRDSIVSLGIQIGHPGVYN